MNHQLNELYTRAGGIGAVAEASTIDIPVLQGYLEGKFEINEINSQYLSKTGIPQSEWLAVAVKKEKKRPNPPKIVQNPGQRRGRAARIPKQRYDYISGLSRSNTRISIENGYSPSDYSQVMSFRKNNGITIPNICGHEGRSSNGYCKHCALFKGRKRRGL